MGGGVAYNHYTTDDDSSEPTTYLHLFEGMPGGKDVLAGGDGVSFRLADTKFNCYIGFSANMMNMLSCFQSEEYDPDRGTESAANPAQSSFILTRNSKTMVTFSTMVGSSTQEKNPLP